MSDPNRRERAKAMFEEVNGFPAPTDPPDFFQQASLDQVFGEVWTRSGLTRKERRWITLTTIAMTGAETAMNVHIRSALGSGDITREELTEFCGHFAHYAGFPIATRFYHAFQRIVAEIDAGS
jgi:4-carboxymuconolactone decarboxylase